jgi:ribonucleotide reductase beta subunit family protein with ferritin-like domain
VKVEKKERKPEPILMENPQRFVILPIKYDKVWQMYKKQEASFWTTEEIDLSQVKIISLFKFIILNQF